MNNVFMNISEAIKDCKSRHNGTLPALNTRKLVDEFSDLLHDCNDETVNEANGDYYWIGLKTHYGQGEWTDGITYSPQLHGHLFKQYRTPNEMSVYQQANLGAKRNTLFADNDVYLFPSLCLANFKPKILTEQNNATITGKSQPFE